MSDTHRTVKAFDRKLGSLEGLPDVVKTKASTVRAIEPLVGESATFIVQTYRQWKKGDTVFVEFVAADQSLRFVLPPEVMRVIHGQANRLSTASRRKLGKERADELRSIGQATQFQKKARTS